MKNTPENRVTRAVKLATSHLVDWFRNNTGVADYNGRKVAYGVGGEGGADYLGIVRENTPRAHRGQLIACEMKAPGEKPEPEQLEFLARVQRSGGLAVVAYRPEDVMRVLGLPDSAMRRA